MSGKFLLVFLVFITALMLPLGSGAYSDTKCEGNIIVGMFGINDLNSAVNALKENSGDAVIFLTESVSLNQQIEIPADLKGLNSVTLASYDGSPVTVSMNGSAICAKGIPFTVDKNVSLRNGFLFGGNCLAYPGNTAVSSSELIINGAVDYAIGGGLAMASGAVSSVGNVNIVVNGSANVVHGGGYAFNGGIAEVTGTANLVLMRGGVADTMYGGGYAYGPGSSAPINSAHITVLGKVNTANENEGLSDNGGSALVGADNTTKSDQKNPDSPYKPELGIDFPIERPIERRNNSTLILIGSGQQARDFTQAVSLLPRNAGDVEFRITDNFYQSNDVLIPTNRGISSLTITGNSNLRMTVTWPESGGFFANGIPTTITNNVRFNEGIIYGGSNVVSGQKSYLENTSLDIAGTVSRVIAGSKASGSGAEAHVGQATLVFRGKATSWLHAGGGAYYGGLSVIDDTTSLVIDRGASVDYSVSGGGYAFGAGSRSVVKNAYLDISGKITYAVFLGGYADQSSSSVIQGQSVLYLQPDGSVGQSVWCGGRAYNKSDVYVDIASANISGYVGVAVHRYGNATDGSTSNTRIIQ